MPVKVKTASSNWKAMPVGSSTKEILKEVDKSVKRYKGTKKIKKPWVAPKALSSGEVYIPPSMGRPSTYTKEIATELCARLAMGESLRTACKPDHMPAIQTIFNWFTMYPDFLVQYTHAKEEAADAMAEDILDISDDGTNDWMEVNGRDVVDHEAVARSKLRVDTRKFLMSKMKPKRYGDKLDVTSDGKALPAPLLQSLTLNMQKITDLPEIPQNKLIDSIE